MLEIMITVLVISFGLIGMAGLQVATKRAGFQATQRTLALTLANDIVQRLVLNPGNLAAYSTGTGSLGGGSITTTPTKCLVVVATVPCTPAQLVAWDRWDWEQRIDGVTTQNKDASNASVGGLVSPRGCITVNGAQVRVVVSWRGLVASTDPADNNSACGTWTDADKPYRQQVVVNSVISTL
jgi:type IV pilus assembly protein PilV